MVSFRELLRRRQNNPQGTEVKGTEDSRGKRRAGVKRIATRTHAVTGEFVKFLNEYRILGLAIAVVMGTATNTLVQSLVNSIVMPVITAFIPGGDWQKAMFQIGRVIIGLGAFFSALLNFVIIAIIVFFVAKTILKEEHMVKK